MAGVAKLLTPPHNFAVVQLPERNYPGVVLQGDTLRETVRRLAKASELLEAHDFDNAKDEIAYIFDQFLEALNDYRDVCHTNSISPP